MILFKHLILLAGVITIFFTANAQHGFFEDEWQPKTFSIGATTAQSPASGAVTATATIDFDDTLQKVSAAMYGNNASWWMNKGTLTDGVRIKHFRNADISFMRFPGGNSSNRYFWDGNHMGDTVNGANIDPIDGTDNAWMLTLDDFLKLCDSLGNEPVICVNYSYARYGASANPLNQAAHYAADFVRYVNITKGYNVRYWEIGNENFGPWQAGYVVNGDTISGTEYGEGFRIFADSMKAADPTIKVGAPVVSEDDGIITYSGYKWWNQGVLTEAKDHIDFLALHEYFTFHPTDPNLITVQELWDALPLVQQNYDNLQDMVVKYTGYPAETYPVAMTEFNLRGGQKEVAQTSALFITQALGEMMKTGYGMAMLWDMINGYNGDGGDHGMLSKNEPSVTDFTPHPSFYVYYLYTRFFGDHIVGAATNDSDVKVYASTFSSGEVGVVVVNRKGTTEMLEFNMNGFDPSGTYYWYELSAPDILSRKVYLNGVTGSQIAGGPDDYESVLPNTATTTGNIKMELAPFSINFVVANEDVTGLYDMSSVTGPFRVYPNPANEVIAVYPDDEHKGYSLSVFDITGQKLLSAEKVTGKLQQDAMGLSPGIYVMRIETGGQVFVKKVIIK